MSIKIANFYVIFYIFCMLFSVHKISCMQNDIQERYKSIRSRSNVSRKEIVLISPELNNDFKLTLKNNENCIFVVNGINICDSTDKSNNYARFPFAQCVRFYYSGNTETNTGAQKDSIDTQFDCANLFNIACYKRYILNRCERYYILLADKLESFDLLGLVRYLKNEERVYKDGQDNYRFLQQASFGEIAFSIDYINANLSYKLQKSNPVEIFGSCINDIELEISKINTSEASDKCTPNVDTSETKKRKCCK